MTEINVRSRCVSHAIAGPFERGDVGVVHDPVDHRRPGGCLPVKITFRANGRFEVRTIEDVS